MRMFYVITLTRFTLWQKLPMVIDVKFWYDVTDLKDFRKLDVSKRNSNLFKIYKIITDSFKLNSVYQFTENSSVSPSVILCYTFLNTVWSTCMFHITY